MTENREVIEKESNWLHLLYNQTWERLKNMERQRTFFANLYITIVAGIFSLSVAYKWGFQALPYVAVLSIFAFLVNLRINKHILAYNKMMKKIACEVGYGNFDTPGANQEDSITLRRLYTWWMPSLVFGAFLIMGFWQCIQK